MNPATMAPETLKTTHLHFFGGKYNKNMFWERGY